MTDDDEMVPVNVRASRRLLKALDAWAAEMSQGRRGPKIGRPDLIRGVLEWAAETRPDWEQRTHDAGPAPGKGAKRG